MNAAYALAQIGKKTYVIPNSLSKSIEQSAKLSSKGSTYKGNTAYFDVLGYNQYNMLLSKKNKKKDSFQHNSSNKKDMDDTINIKAMEYQALKENPLGLCDENDLRYIMNQNKITIGPNLIVCK